jgi:hypothetical protein
VQKEEKPDEFITVEIMMPHLKQLVSLFNFEMRIIHIPKNENDYYKIKKYDSEMDPADCPVFVIKPPAEKKEKPTEKTSKVEKSTKVAQKVALPLKSEKKVKVEKPKTQDNKIKNRSPLKDGEKVVAPTKPYDAFFDDIVDSTDPVTIVLKPLQSKYPKKVQVTKSDKAHKQVSKTQVENKPKAKISAKPGGKADVTAKAVTKL